MPWNGRDYVNLRLLIKARGKCTTDHISMAGPWLRYRGHLDSISDNYMIGAINSFNDQANNILNQKTGSYEPVPKVARFYKASRLGPIVVGEDSEKGHRGNIRQWNRNS